MDAPGFNIAAVERDTGLSKDVLRMWERRYGFPRPERDDHGERLYPVDQVERLRLIKRLMDQGYRPGKLIPLPPESLVTLAPRRSSTSRKEAMPEEGSGKLHELLDLLHQHDVGGFLAAMQQHLARQGLMRFVHDTVAPLTHEVGTAWESGSIEVFEEHLYTELTKRILRQAIATLPGNGRPPRILLTTVPNEPHLLGLLMAEAIFTLEGADCIPLGTQIPLLEITRAAEAHQADIVGLSFSLAFPSRQIPGILRQLRQALPERVDLWVGGGGIGHLAQQEGISLLHRLQDATAALSDWRSQHSTYHEEK